MVFTNFGKAQFAIRLGSNISESINSIAIGTGSGTALASNTTLVTESDKNALTSTDYSATNKVSWTANWSSTELSGTSFKEFGPFSNSTANTGSAWQREALTGSIVFTGNQEMQVDITAILF